MKILVNKKEVEIPEDVTTLYGFLQYAAIPTKAMAAALNNAVVPRAEWERTLLKEGDVLTIIHAAFGG